MCIQIITIIIIITTIIVITAGAVDNLLIFWHSNLEAGIGAISQTCELFWFSFCCSFIFIYLFFFITFNIAISAVAPFEIKLWQWRGYSALLTALSKPAVSVGIRQTTSG